MAWTKEQKSLAARACAAARMSDEHRLLLLRQCPRSVHEGRVTSTSPRLTNSDFEQFMAVVEKFAGGRIKVGGKRGEGFGDGYWQKCASDRGSRQRHRVRQLVQELEAAGRLQPDSAGLRGWIRDRVTSGRTEQLEDLTPAELEALIQGLTAYGRRHGLCQGKQTIAP